MKKIYFNKILEVGEIKGMRCDGKDCDYFVPDATFEDSALYLEQPCPKCGTILLTLEDYRLIKFIFFVEKWLGWIRIPSFKCNKFRVGHMNGSGKLFREDQRK